MKRLTLLLVLLAVLINPIFSQEIIDVKETFMEAEYYILYDDYKEALPLYLRLLNNGMDNAYVNYRLGECYLQIPGQKHKSIAHLEKAITDISATFKEGSFKETHAPKKAIFLLGNAYQINNKLDKAISTYKMFKESLDVNDVYNIDYVDQQITACENAKELMKYPTRIKESNLGEIINDEFANIRPIVSGNEQIILYTSKLKFYDAVYYSEKNGTLWDSPINLTPIIKSDGDYYTSSLSFDGNTVILFRDEKFSGDLYSSKFENGVWQLPVKFNKHINSKSWETHGVISNDGKTFYFASDRKGGFGGLDIYKSQFDDQINDWGIAVNLGPEINTPYNEDFPMISEDGNTLWFASQGHYNMGGFDIFYSKKINENQWSNPVNIGYPINTTDDNLFFYPVKNGDFAYTSKYSPDGFGSDDIVRYEIFGPEHPFIINIKGTLTLLDNQTDFVPGDFTIEIIDSLNLTVVSKTYPEEEKGTFSAQLKPGLYRFNFNSIDYKPKSTILFIPEDYPREELTLNIELTPLSVTSGEYISVKSIFFNFDDFKLTREAKIELERLYNLMVRYPSLYIEVIGHTDAIGSSQYNYNLSLKRARSAIDYLIKNGIDPKRFVAKGAGKSQPVAINTNQDGSDNVEGRKFNRRVEIKILKSEEKLIIGEDLNIPENLKERDFTYTILLLKNEEKLPADYFDKYDALDNIEIKEYQDGLFIYTLPMYKQKSDLVEIFNTILETGFSEAEIISSYDLQNMLNENESVVVFDEPIGPVSYAVQLKATKTPIDINTFKSLTNVKEIKCMDGFYRYIIGVYKSKSAADKELKKVIEKGFTEALIIDMAKLK
jgi:outer membrane protein OmpA-like peptidoglycan-associated protein